MWHIGQWVFSLHKIGKLWQIGQWVFSLHKIGKLWQMGQCPFSLNFPILDPLPCLPRPTAPPPATFLSSTHRPISLNRPILDPLSYFPSPSTSLSSSHCHISLNFSFLYPLHYLPQIPTLDPLSDLHQLTYLRSATPYNSALNLTALQSRLDRQKELRHLATNFHVLY